MDNREICVHTIDIDNYFPELKALTLPTIERFCEKIKADLKIIRERKFPGWPILTEKLQVHNQGEYYRYNILLDLDVLVHPDCYNPFEKNIPPTYCAFKDNYNASKQLRSDIYFQRDGRDIGISGCAVFSTFHTHDLWKFQASLRTNKDLVLGSILQERKIVDEYIISRNLAKYGLKYVAPYPIHEYDLMFHLGNYGQNKEDMMERAKLWYKTFWR
jgi:hypothetical protein